MLIAAIVVSSVLFYALGLGFTIRFVDRHTRWEDEAIWFSSVFLWPIILASVGAWVGQEALADWNRKRKEQAALPPIHIRRGARIEEWKQYKQLVALCSEFEAENGISDRMLSM